MNTQENHSEIARLRRRIAEEYEAATRGLAGFASGSARHQWFVNVPVRGRLDRHKALSLQMG